MDGRGGFAVVDGRRARRRVERGAHGLTDQPQAVDGADGPEHTRGVRPLAPPGLDHPQGLQALRPGITQAAGGLMVGRPPPEHAEDGATDVREKDLSPRVNIRIGSVVGLRQQDQFW
jgi:hypothetical protein